MNRSAGVVAVMLFVGASQNLPAKTTNKPHLTPAERLQKLKLTSGANPLLPVLMQAFERQLQGLPADSPMGRVVRDSMQRHRELDTTALKTAVQEWQAVPLETKRRLVPAELIGIAPSQKIDIALVRQLAVRATPRVTPAAALQSRPYITAVYGVDPAKPDEGELPRIVAGQGMMLDSRNVPADPAKIKVQFLDADSAGDAPPNLVASASPSKATMSPGGVTTILVTVPQTLGYGEYAVRLTVTGSGNSNEKWVTYATPKLKLAPAISAISPASEYPVTAEKMNDFASWPSVSGALFTKAIDGAVFEPLPEENLGAYRAKGAVRFVSTTQMKLTAPHDILPGKYRVALSSHGKPVSNWVHFTVRAPLYQLKFTTITCGDESDPETNSDSIRTIWVIGSTGGALWTKVAGGYNGFGDGVSKYYKPEHQWVFVPDGHAGEVRRYLYVVTSVWEWDSGEDWDSRINAIAGVAADVAKEIGGGHVDYGVLAHYVSEAIEELVILFHGEPNFIGSNSGGAIAFSADVLQKLTAKNPSFEDSLMFAGDDDTGAYKLTYKVFREQP